MVAWQCQEDIPESKAKHHGHQVKKGNRWIFLYLAADPFSEYNPYLVSPSFINPMGKQVKA